MDLSEAEREKYQQGNNEDTHVVGDAHFVRGWAPIPVRGYDQDWGLGFWIKLSGKDFADFETRRRVNHPKYTGTIANQSLYGAPTLGLAAEIEFRAVGLRPLIRLTDGKHPLTEFQRQGLDKKQWRRWLSATFHQGDPEPAAGPFLATFDQHGWTIYDPRDFGKVPHEFSSLPKAGDTVKVMIGVRTANRSGEVKPLNAGWWVRLDDVTRPDLWGGTLASHTRVQATITLGSRVWLKPGQVLEHTPTEDTQ